MSNPGEYYDWRRQELRKAYERRETARNNLNAAIVRGDPRSIADAKDELRKAEVAYDREADVGD